MVDETVMRELIEFLEPTTRLDVRRTALEYIVGISGAFDGSAGKLFADNDFAMGKALCKLCEATVSDRSPTLAALTNFSSGSAEAANFILHNSRTHVIAYEACKLAAPFAKMGAQLLANLSRHFPDKLLDDMVKHDELFIANSINLAFSDPTSLFYLAFVVVNVSTLGPVRKSLVDDAATLAKIYSYISLESNEMREAAADILRNLAFDEGLHTTLLETNDAYLVSLLKPLCDTNDELDDDEMQKLPLQLQYFEGTRETSPHIRQRLIEALYQLCATRVGREKLRTTGVYPLLRELDKATREPEDPHAPPPKMKALHLLAQEEHTLHALIGILIRYEEEMCISNEVESLKHLS